MLATRVALPAAWLLLLGCVSAVPAQAADPTHLSASVDGDAHSKTVLVAPVSTTTSGTATVLSPAAHEAPATTSSAQPVPANDTGNDAAGGSPACRNPDGEFRPFCLPRHHDTFYPDSMHYITWDPSYFPSPNTTLRIFGFYAPETNSSSSTAHFDGQDEAFSTHEIEAWWGLYQWQVDKSLLEAAATRAGGRQPGGGDGSEKSNANANVTAAVTLRVVYRPSGAEAAVWVRGPTVRVAAQPPQPPQTPPPEDKQPLTSKGKKKTRPSTDSEALYVALPAVSIFAVVMVFGTFVCNRQARVIGIGNVMGRRGRRDKSRRQRILQIAKGKGKVGEGNGRDAEQSIRLMDRDANAGGGDDDDAGAWGYWDAEEDEGWRRETTGRPKKRDSNERYR